MSDGYAGDVRPSEAWEILKEEPSAVLVDVRTQAEWSYVGLPDLSQLGRQPIKLAWQIFPEMTVNQDFLDGLAKAGVTPDRTVLLICRSGVRSQAAARYVTQAGFPRAYNVADGFEGPHDASRHRGTLAGWKADGLPWAQN